MTKTRKPQPKHWYKIFIGECPVCGSDAGYRVRMYTERPIDVQERYEYLSDTLTYDYCNAL